MVLQCFSCRTRPQRQQALLMELHNALDHLERVNLFQLVRKMDGLHRVQILRDDVDVST